MRLSDLRRDGSAVTTASRDLPDERHEDQSSRDENELDQRPDAMTGALRRRGYESDAGRRERHVLRVGTALRNLVGVVRVHDGPQNGRHGGNVRRPVGVKQPHESHQLAVLLRGVQRRVGGELRRRLRLHAPKHNVVSMVSAVRTCTRTARISSARTPRESRGRRRRSRIAFQSLTRTTHSTSWTSLRLGSSIDRHLAIVQRGVSSIVNVRGFREKLTRCDYGWRERNVGGWDEIIHSAKALDRSESVNDSYAKS